MSAMDLVIMNKQNPDNPLYVHNDNGDRIDISDQPILQHPNLVDSFRSYVDNVDMNKLNKRYMYNGVPVPRVTTILEYCSGSNEYLMRWAARLGDKYTYEKQRTLDIGSKVHEVIEEYLTLGTTYGLKNLSSSMKNEVQTSFNNFLSWYKRVTVNFGWRIEIFASEIPLICPWFGGTADAIMVINGRRYIIDFKTSKKLTLEYFIQVSVYKWIIDNFYPDLGVIDGIGLLRFDKTYNVYEDIYLDVSNNDDSSFINYCQQIFSLALNLYYSMKSMEVDMNTIKKNKKEERKNDLQNS